MKTYRIARHWARITYALATLVIGFFGFLLLLPLYDDHFPLSVAWMTGPLSLGMIGWMVVGLLDTYKGRIHVAGDTLSTDSIFGRRSLQRSDILGYRITNSYLIVYPRNPRQHKKINISVYLDQLDELVDWLAVSAPDLDES